MKFVVIWVCALTDCGKDRWQELMLVVDAYYWLSKYTDSYWLLIVEDWYYLLSQYTDKYWLLIWRDEGQKTWAGKIWLECVCGSLCKAMPWRQNQNINAISWCNFTHLCTYQDEYFIQKCGWEVFEWEDPAFSYFIQQRHIDCAMYTSPSYLGSVGWDNPTFSYLMQPSHTLPCMH